MAFSAVALRRIRQARGLTQGDAALIVDCPLVTYQKWEQGFRVPNDESQLRLARKLHVELIDLHTQPEEVAV